MNLPASYWYSISAAPRVAAAAPAKVARKPRIVTATPRVVAKPRISVKPRAVAVKPRAVAVKPRAVAVKPRAVAVKPLAAAKPRTAATQTVSATKPSSTRVSSKAVAPAALPRFNPASPFIFLKKAEVFDSLKVKVSIHTFNLALLLRKAGLNNATDLVTAAGTHRKMSQKAALRGNVDVLESPALVKLVSAHIKTTGVVVKTSMGVGLRRSGYLGRPAAVLNVANQKVLADTLAYTYNFTALKLCSVLSLDPKTHMLPISTYMLLGKASTKVPAAVKSLAQTRAQMSTRQSVEDALDTIKLQDVTVRLLKKHGHDLVERLPKMWTALVKETSPVKRKRSPLPKYGRFRYSRPAVKKDMTNARAVVATLEKDVQTLLSYLIPDLKDPTILAEIKKLDSSVSSLQTSLRMANRALLIVKRQSNPKTRSLNAAQVKLEAAKEKLKAARIKQRAAKSITPTLPTWALPFVSTTVDLKSGEGKNYRVILGDGILITRLVNLANSGKLKSGAPELTAPLDPANAELLTLAGLSDIIEEGYDGSSIKAFKGIFKKCADSVKARIFVSQLLGSKPLALETGIGKVTNARLLRLNNVEFDDVAALTTQYAPEIAAWNPLRTEVDAVVSKIQKENPKTSSKYTVKAATASQLTEWRKQLPDFIAGIHGVELVLMKAWAVTRPASLTSILTNSQNSKILKVIPNVFHGTSRQTAGVILTYGFKINGTKVTGRSMGDVLYLAPNIDKSAQYLGKGFGRKDGQTGIIFVGDAIISGAAGGARRKFGYKTIKFATEELGLPFPNNQYVIRRVYQIKLQRINTAPTRRAPTRLGPPKKKTGGASTKFASSIAISSYLAAYTE